MKLVRTQHKYGVVTIALALLLVGEGILAYHIWQVQKDNSAEANFTDGSTAGFPSEPMTPSGVPALLSGETPARTQFLRSLEAHLDVAKPITSSQIGVLGTIIAIRGNVLTVQKIEFSPTSPTAAQALSPTIHSLVGAVGGQVQLVATSQTEYANTSSLATLRVGDTIIAGGAKQGNSQLQAAMIGLVTGKTRSVASIQSVLPVAAMAPIAPTTAHLSAAILPRVEAASYGTTPLQTDLTMQGGVDPTNGVERFNVFGEKTDQFGSCFATWHIQSMSDFHADWHWPFSFSVPDRNQVQLTGLSRQPVNGAVVMGSTDPSLPDNANFTFYSGWGVAEGAGVKVGCTFKGVTKGFPIDLFSASYGLVNASYGKPPLAGDAPLSVDTLKCLEIDPGIVPTLGGIAEKAITSLFDIDTTNKICLKLAVQPAALHAHATYDDGTSEPLVFGTTAQKLGAAATSSGDVQLSNFSYTPTLQSEVIVSLGSQFDPSSSTKEVPFTAPLTTLLSNPNPDHVILPLQEDSLSLQSGSQTLHFANVVPRVCKYGTDSSGGHYLTVLTATYNGQPFEFDIGAGNVSVSKNPSYQVANWQENQAPPHGDVIFDLKPQDSGMVYAKSISGSLTLSIDRFGGSIGYYSALQANTSLSQSIGNIHMGNATITGFWHCPSGSYPS